MTKELINWEDPKYIKLVKDLCSAADLSEAEYDLFVAVCKQRGLNPVIKHIYPIKRQGKMTIQVGIDGYRVLADRTGCYMPGKASTYKYEGDKLVSATAYVMKYKKGAWHETASEAFMVEFCPMYNGKAGGQWGKMPHVMLAKCAETAALRRAFAAELSGIYTTEEMEQADSDGKPMSIEANIEPEELQADINEKLTGLQEALELEGVDSGEISAYLQEHAKLKKLSVYDLATSALESRAVFIPHYKKWLATKETDAN